MATASHYHGDDDSYPMESNPRGVCVVINNQTFDDPRSLKTLDGSEIDRDALVRTFTRLHFEVKCFNNQTDREMYDILQKESVDPTQSRHDCFVCCILSHGDEGKVYSRNGVAVPIKDLTSLMKPAYCRYLTGKPKLFFIEACQGGGTQQGYEMPRAQVASLRKEDMIPGDADFFLGYASVPGYKAWVDSRTGSRFTRHLTDCLESFAHIEEISHLFYKVNNRVTKEGESDKKQTPSVFHTLRKKLHLLPQRPVIQKTAKEDRPVRKDVKKKEPVQKIATKIRPQQGHNFSMSAVQASLPTVHCQFDPMSATPSRGVTLESRAEGESERQYIPSLLVDPTSSYVYMTDFSNKSIKVASLQSGKLLSTLKPNSLPWRAAVDPSDGNTLFVISPFDYVISCIDVTNKSKLQVKKTIKVKREYSGVCSVLSGSDVTLVVSCYEDKDGPASVDVITLDGGHVRTVVSGDTLPGLFLNDYLCLGNNNTDLFVSDYFNHCLYQVELSTGRVTDTLKHPDLKCPCQMCTDSAGNLYVASQGGECVLVRSVDGEWRTLLTGKEHGEGECVFPWGLSVSVTGIVVSWSGDDSSVVKKHDLV